MARALVALGSNQGERAAAIEAALEAICRLTRTCVSARSSVHETRPVGGPPQGPFLNAAAEVATQLSPRELLSGLLAIERSLGRVRREP
ncbi:2-amino-4-hydroxy-6-hydroxymethyldihydropteridine diphosphokinase, partial [bacterium]|nr:2-amino-4-hydroxy-6-hydroxymethyldihydropteridine diphosphokinase [bacterium]